MEQNRDAPVALFLSDLVRLRKPHPCGSFEWTVVRLGADIGLTCNGCGRRVLLPRRELQRRTRLFVSRGPGFAAAQQLIADHDAAKALTSESTGSRRETMTTTSESVVDEQEQSMSTSETGTYDV